MHETFEMDMVFKTILSHLTQEKNLNAPLIKEKVLENGIIISLPALKKRIDEFKKSQAYKDFSKESSTS
jgi:hypothetical protein